MYCRKCGKQIDDTAAFCRFCGTPINSAQNNVQQNTPPAPSSSYDFWRNSSANQNIPAAPQINNNPIQRNAPQTQRYVSKKSRVFTVFLAVLLCTQTLIAGFVRPGWFVSRETDGNIVGLSDNNGSDAVGRSEMQYLYDRFGTEDKNEMKKYFTDSSVKYSDEEIAAAPKHSVEVSCENYTAVFDDMTVDLNPFNFDDEEAHTFTVSTLPVKSEPETGLVYNIWNFELDGRHEFDHYINVTVPYGDVHDPYDIIAEHYNDQMGMWEYIPYEIDEENKTVTFSLIHFQNAGIVQSYKNEIEGEKKYMDVGWMDSQELNTENRYMKIRQLSPAKLERAFGERLNNDTVFIGIMKEKYTRETMSWIDSFSNDYGPVVTVGDYSVDFSKFIGCDSYIPKYVKNGIGNLGNAFTAVTMINTYLKNNSFSEVLEKHWSDILKFAIDKAATKNPYVFLMKALVDSFAFGHEKVSAFYSDVVYNGHSSAAEDAYYTFTEKRMFWIPDKKAFNYKLTQEDAARMISGYHSGSSAWIENKANDNYAYLNSVKTVPFDVESYDVQLRFMKMITEASKKYPDNPEKWLDPVNDELWKAASYFWTLPKDKREILTDGLSNVSGQANVSRDTQIKYTKQMYNVYKKKLQKSGFYDKYLEFYKNKVKEQVNNIAFEFMDRMNRTVSFRLDMTDESGKSITFAESEYKDCYIIIDPTEHNNLKLIKPWEVNKNSTELFDCTYFSYGLAGYPTKILIYDSELDYLSKKAPKQTVSFKPIEDANEVVVSLTAKSQEKEDDTAATGAMKGGWSLVEQRHLEDNIDTKMPFEAGFHSFSEIAAAEKESGLKVWMGGYGDGTILKISPGEYTRIDFRTEQTYLADKADPEHADKERAYATSVWKREISYSVPGSYYSAGSTVYLEMYNQTESSDVYEVYDESGNIFNGFVKKEEELQDSFEITYGYAEQYPEGKTIKGTGSFSMKAPTYEEVHQYTHEGEKDQFTIGIWDMLYVYEWVGQEPD